MRKKWIVISVSAIILLLIIFSYPTFFILKPYGHSCGDFVCLPVNRICECNGIKYNYNLPWGAVEHYCFGTIKNCKCYNESKTQLLSEKYPNGFQNYNKIYHTNQEVIDNAYDSCP